MSGDDLLLVAPFPSELPRGTGLQGLTCGSRSSWRDGPPPALPEGAALIVTGSCGALHPGPLLGRLVLPARVRGTDGEVRRPDESLRARLAAGAAAAGVPVEEGSLAEACAVVDSPAGRAALAEATGCDFVDLESASLAAAAEASGRPWAVLRFVSDGPEQPLAWLSELYGGFPVREPGVGQTLAALARRPRHLRRLLALGRRVARGREAVGRVLDHLPG